MLRSVTRRVFMMANGLESLDEAIDALRALGLSATRLAVLLKSQAELGSEHVNEFLQEVSSVVRELLEDWHWSQ